MSAEDVLVVSNAAAGSVDDNLVQSVRDQLTGRCEFEWRATDSAGDLKVVLEELNDRRLLVLGGDGSVHAVASVLYELAALKSAVVGLIPTGTGNDLARSLGIPLEIPDAVETALGPHLRELDILETVGQGVVVNVVHVGIGAEAAQAGKSVKALLGAAGYTVGALAAGIKSPGSKVTIEVDERVWVEPPEAILMAAMTVGGTIGGGTPIAPEAVVDDGRADVVISSATGPFSRIGYAADLRKGEHVHRDDVLTTRGRVVRIFGDPFPVNTDGELESDVTDRTWRVRPAAWTIAVPGPRGG